MGNLFDDRCSVTEVSRADLCVVYYVVRDGISSYCKYVECEVDGVFLCMVEHSKVNREEDLSSEFRIEVVKRV